MTQCNWWNRSIVVVRIDGQDFYMGEASGWEHNCMIYTLQQCSAATLTCDVTALRKLLEEQHEGSTTRIKHRDLLDFASHCLDVLRHMSRHLED